MAQRCSRPRRLPVGEHQLNRDAAAHGQDDGPIFQGRGQAPDQGDHARLLFAPTSTADISGPRPANPLASACTARVGLRWRSGYRGDGRTPRAHLTYNRGRWVPPTRRWPSGWPSRRGIVKVGIALDILTKEGRFDARRLRRTMALGDLAEPLRFDSLCGLEHHSSSRRTSGPSPRPTTCSSSWIASCQCSGAIRPLPAIRSTLRPGRPSPPARGRDLQAGPGNESRRDGVLQRAPLYGGLADGADT